MRATPSAKARCGWRRNRRCIGWTSRRAVFIGAAASYRAGAHIAVALLTDRLPPAVRKPLGLLVHLLMLAACVFMLVWGTKLCVQTWNQTISELPWLPVGVTYSPVPIGGALTLLFVLEHLLLGSQAERGVMRYDQQLEEAAAESL
jgi:TRAP-type C4-dicarboxylate transport system permease small subunit